MCIILILFSNSNVLIADSSNKAYFAQQISELNKLKSLLNNEKFKSTKYFDLLDQLTRDYEFIDLDSCKYYANTHLKLANSTNSNKERMRAYLNLGNYYQTLQDFNNSFINLEHSFDLAVLNEDYAFTAKVCNTISYTLNNLESPDTSIEFLKVGYKNAIKSKDSLLIYKVLINLGASHSNLFKYYEAIEYYNKSLEYIKNYQDTNVKIKSTATVFNNIGLIYKQIGNLNKAESYLLNAYNIESKLFNDLKNKRVFNYGGNLYTIQHLLGSLYFTKKDFEKAIMYLESSLKGNKELKDYEIAIDDCLLLADINLSKGDINQAKYYKDLLCKYDSLTKTTNPRIGVLAFRLKYLNYEKQYHNAFVLGDSLAHLYHNTTNKLEFLDLVEQLIISLEKLNNIQKLNYYLKLKIKLVDEIHKSSRISETINLQAKYEYKQKLDKIMEDNKLKKISQNNELIFQKTLAFTFIFFSILLLILGFILFRNWQKIKLINSKLKENQEELENYNLEITKNNELILNQKEELLSFNKTLDKYFGILSHDLRSPLSGILLNLSNILDYSNKFTKEIILDKINNTKNNLEKVFLLLEELLKISQQINILEFEEEVLSLNELIDKSISLMSEIINNKSLTIKNNIDTNIQVLVDYKLIDSVFRNILSNAIKFTPKNGEISFSSEIYDEKTLLISIKDSGIGMNQEQIKNIFNMEKITSTRGTEGEKGFGFGMLLVKDNIEKHKCKIWIESEENIGTTFYFTLPLYKENTLL